jgi:hypothetical protein
VLAALRGAHLVEGSAKSTLSFNKNSKISFAVGLVVIVLSAAIFIILLNLNS